MGGSVVESTARAVGSPKVQRDPGNAEAVRRRVIVLPEVPLPGRAPAPATEQPQASPPLSAAEALAREFDGVVDRTVVERVTAAARHALERSRIAATPDAVERLAREHLRVHADARHAKRRRH